MKSKAVGILEAHYSNTTDKRMHQLRDKGWCILKGAMNANEVKIHIQGFENELKSYGFDIDFSDAVKTNKVKNFQQTLWTIDTYLLPLGPTATSMRVLMRRELTKALQVEEGDWASSFDGVMCSSSRSVGKAGPLIPGTDGQPFEMPCLVNDAGIAVGPTHIDQSRLRDATAESHQCFCPLTKAELQDFSTILYVPSEGWTLQSVRNSLVARFPEVYNSSYVKNSLKRKRGEKKESLGDEGYFIPREHCEYLKDIGACQVFKPQLEPGDMLIWSSALLHCGGCVQSDKPRGPRLGVISAFAPKSFLSSKAIHNRAKWIGSGYATGQLLVNPSKHGYSIPHVARVKKEFVPEPYKKLREWREYLKTHPLYVDQPEDDSRALTYRANLRDLLGLDR